MHSRPGPNRSAGLRSRARPGGAAGFLRAVAAPARWAGAAFPSLIVRSRIPRNLTRSGPIPSDIVRTLPGPSGQSGCAGDNGKSRFRRCGAGPGLLRLGIAAHLGQSDDRLSARSPVAMFSVDTVTERSSNLLRALLVPGHAGRRIEPGSRSGSRSAAHGSSTIAICCLRLDSVMPNGSAHREWRTDVDWPIQISESRRHHRRRAFAP